MINRVFIYSDEEAQKNGNYTTLGRLFLVLFGMMAVMLIVIFASVEIDFSFEGGAGFLLIIAMIALMLIYGFSWRKKYFARLSSFATDTENNVYYVKNLNPNGNVVVGGVLARDILGNNMLGNMAQIAGTVAAANTLTNAAKIMQCPEVIAKIVENSTETYGVDVYKILKVYNYVENSHVIKVRCDYQIINKGKVKNNATLTIYKSYNSFKDLINTILNINNK